MGTLIDFVLCTWVEWEGFSSLSASHRMFTSLAGWQWPGGGTDRSGLSPSGAVLADGANQKNPLIINAKTERELRKISHPVAAGIFQATRIPSRVWPNHYFS